MNHLNAETGAGTDNAEFPVTPVIADILNSNAHAIRVSVTLDTLANILDVGTLVNANMVINSLSLLVKMQKLDMPTINYKMNQLNKIGRHKETHHWS